jgi:threonine dehydrogenase-like Zn-dependent dehydrogenase
MVSFTVFKGSPDGSIVETTTTKEVGPDEVLVQTTHSGVCGTDEHQRHKGIGLGHEGVGVVKVRTSTIAHGSSPPIPIP